jgi:hypothetical protein
VSATSQLSEIAVFDPQVTEPSMASALDLKLTAFGLPVLKEPSMLTVPVKESE